MPTVRYCTPEWLEASAAAYRANPRFQEAMARLTAKVCFGVQAEPAWGIDRDIIFGGFLTQGALEKLAFFSPEEAAEQAEFVLVATPQEWKRILRKEAKFVTDFMLGRIKLDQGSIPGVLGIAPYAGTFVDALTQVELRFPDEMTPEELEAYRIHLQTFRSELGV
jgi:hypothetical protein